MTLQGTGTASNPFVNFQTQIMQGTAWNWTGSGTFHDRAVAKRHTHTNRHARDHPLCSSVQVQRSTSRG